MTIVLELEEGESDLVLVGPIEDGGEVITAEDAFEGWVNYRISRAKRKRNK
jgi:hypothetical protein